ncbi:RPL28 family protein [Megaselia abdita]
MSAHLNWLIIRDNNCHLLKQRNVKKPFSTEANNLTNLSTFRYSGLVHKKTLAIKAADKKGFTVTLNKGKLQQCPARNKVSVTFKAGPRRSLKKLKHLLVGNKYRNDLKQAALRKASALLRSQRPAKVKPAKKTE